MGNVLRRRLILAACAAALAAGGAALAGYLSDDFRREARLALGLPKFWVTNFYVDEATHARVACPDPASDPIVIVTGGQSFAGNAHGPIKDVIGNPRNAQVFAGKCFALESPVLGANTHAMAVWPKLGDLLERATGRPVVFINGAVGGSQIADFLDERSGYLPRLTTTVGEAHVLGLSPDIAIWIQGTTDAAIGMDPATYVADQKAVIASIESAIPGGARPDWIIPLSTACQGRAGTGKAIEQALVDFGQREGARFHIAPDISAYGPELRYDGCHLNPAGRDRLAQELADIVLPILAAKAASEDGEGKAITPRG